MTNLKQAFNKLTLLGKILVLLLVVAFVAFQFFNINNLNEDSSWILQIVVLFTFVSTVILSLFAISYVFDDQITSILDDMWDGKIPRVKLNRSFYVLLAVITSVMTLFYTNTLKILLFAEFIAIVYFCVTMCALGIVTSNVFRVISAFNKRFNIATKWNNMSTTIKHLFVK